MTTKITTTTMTMVSLCETMFGGLSLSASCCFEEHYHLCPVAFDRSLQEARVPQPCVLGLDSGMLTSSDTRKIITPPEKVDSALKEVYNAAYPGTAE